MGLVALPTPPDSQAWDMNDAGRIVGEFDAPGDGFGPLAFVHDGEQLIQLMPPGGTFSQARSVNTLGRVVGTTADGTPYFKAFSWENGVMTLIEPTFGTRSSAWDVNDAGQVVGWMGNSRTIDGHPFRWDSGTMTDLGLR